MENRETRETDVRETAVRPTPVYDRFFSEIVKAVQAEDGAKAYEAFYRALNLAYQGKKDLGSW